MHREPRDFDPRALTSREAAALRFLVEANFPGAAELREQAAFAQAKGDWGDCCPSILLTVDPAQAPQANVRQPIPVEAPSRPGHPSRQLVLFVDDGWLSSLELVHHEEEPGPSLFPDPDEFFPPWWDAESYALSKNS